MFSDMPRPIVGSGSDGGFDFPNMSDGDDLTIYNNRLTNVTIAKVKSYKGNLYVEVEGDLNITGQATGYDSWTLTSAVASSLDTSKQFEVYLDTSKHRASSGCYVHGAYISTSNRGAGVLTYGSGSLNGVHVHIKIIAHDQY